MSEEPDLLTLLYHIPVAVAQIDRQGNVAIMNPLGCQLLMRISADPDLDNLFGALSFDGQLRQLVEGFEPAFGVVCDAFRLRCVTHLQETVYLEFTIHRLETDRFLFAFRDVTQVVINEMRVAQSLRNLENLISSIARLQVSTREVEIVLQPLLLQMAEWVGADSAVLLRGHNSGKYDILLRVGKLLEDKDLSCLTTEDVRHIESVETIPVHEVPIMVTSKDYSLYTNPGLGRVDEEAYYLLKLFIQAAAQALENASLQEQLVRQERLSAVGQAMSSVVHDLRNPIATIRTAIEMAGLKRGDPKVVDRMHAIVLRSVDDAFSMVNDVLDFVREAGIEKSAQTLSSVFADVLEQTLVTTERTGVKVTIALTDLTVAVDSRKIVRALVNLVNNACEALQKRSNGEVTVDGRREESGQVVIGVRDNGPGIPEEIRATVFEAFVTSGKAGGTGLGLAITRQIVLAHGGTIAFETGHGGTCFSIHLPN